MKKEGNPIGISILVALLFFAGVSGASELGSALKSIDKATKGVGGIVAEVEFTEVIDKRPASGKGKVWANMGGLMRAEIGGDTPRTYLIYPPYLYVHRINDGEVDVYDMFRDPDRLGQYIMLGFAPAGSDMKKRFQVELVERGTLGGRPVPSFVITPKSKEASASIARIQLWVDPESGLPLRHEMNHAGAKTQLKIDWVSIDPRDDLPASLFQPKWPEGTKLVRRD